MKFPNYLKNVFAGLGIVSLIFYTCAAADEVASDNDNNNNNPQTVNTYGKYQISSISNVNNATYVFGLNTETGEVVRRFVNNDNFTFTH